MTYENSPSSPSGYISPQLNFQKLLASLVSLLGELQRSPELQEIALSVLPSGWLKPLEIVSQSINQAGKLSPSSLIRLLTLMNSNQEYPNDYTNEYPTSRTYPYRDQQQNPEDQLKNEKVRELIIERINQHK